MNPPNKANAPVPTPTTHGGLLEYIAGQCHCAFLSDLRYSPGLVKDVLPLVPEESFSLQEWEDAVQYISGYDLHFQSAAEAKAFLMDKQPEK